MTAGKEDILVLMSTYNGEHYIDEQIKSILGQRGVNVHLLIRDDGSSDKTVEIIQLINDNRITLLRGDNTGCVKSFSQLVNYANEFYSDCRYYSFADQDDVWLEDKLVRGISQISTLNSDVPNLYFCNMCLVDKNCKYIKNMREYLLEIKKGNCLLDGRAPGCSMVFNRKAIELYSACNPKTSYHDYWIYLICVFMGVVVYDDKAFMLYRQHDDNLIGASGLISLKVRWQKRLSFWLAAPNSEKQTIALEFKQSYGNSLTGNDIKILDSYIFYKKSWRHRWKLLQNQNFTIMEVDYKYIKKKMLFIIKVLLGKL